MEIKVLGTGCPKCQQVKKTAGEVLKELGIDAPVQEVKDVKGIMEYPVLSTPGLVINEKVVCSGRVPSKAEVTTFITTALGEEKRG